MVAILDKVESEAGETAMVGSLSSMASIDGSLILTGEVLLDSSSAFVRTTTASCVIRLSSLIAGTFCCSPFEPSLVRGARGLRAKNDVIGLE